MDHSHNQDIKITLEYNGYKLSVTTKKFKQLFTIKEKAYKLFFPIKGDITLYYKNQSLDKYIEKPIGFFFKSQGAVTIQVRKNELSSSKSFVSKSVALPAINKASSQRAGRNYSKAFNSSKMSYKSQQNNLNYLDLLCSECHSENVCFYCRNCNKFICYTCSTNNSMHPKHNYVQVNSNTKVFLTLYKNQLESDINSCVNSLSNIQGEEFKEKEFNLEAWKEKFDEGQEKMANIAEGILKEGPRKNNKDGQSEDKESEKESKISKKSEEENKSFDNLYENEKNSLNNITCDKYKDPFDLFMKIYESEKRIKKSFKDDVNYKKKVHMKNKIEGMYQSVEDEIDKQIMFLNYIMNKDL